MYKYIFAISFFVLSAFAVKAQVAETPEQSQSTDTLNYLNPKEYILGGVTITGAKNLDKDVLITISKLNKGDRITLPGEANAKVVKDMYSQGLFEDVQLNITKTNLDTIYLEIVVYRALACHQV
ncbi:MAG: outer membrane protein assembly factor BamA, partial [Pedobacter sp.]